MGIAEVIRPLVLAGLLLAAAGAAMPAAAAECPAAPVPAGPARALTLHQVLALPDRPEPGIEGNTVTTIGYLIRVRRIAVAALPPACATGGPMVRLWVATRRPYGLKGLTARHRAVVATVPMALLQHHAGGPHALDKLMGRRIRITGQMTFNGGGRDEMMRTRGTLWELHALSEITSCPLPSCTLAPAAATHHHPVNSRPPGNPRPPVTSRRH